MKEQDRQPDFEELLRRKAAGFKPKPSDDVWANVKISLQEKKRRRGFFWMWAAAIGLLLGAGVFGWMMFANRPVPTISNQMINGHNEQQVASSSDSGSARKSMNQVIPGVNENSGSTEMRSDKKQISTSGEEATNTDKQAAAKQSVIASAKTKEHVAETKAQHQEQKITSSATYIPEEHAPIISEAIIPDSSQSTAASHSGSIDTSTATVLKIDSAQQLNENAITEAILKDSLTQSSLSPTVTENSHDHRFSLEGEVIPLISYRVLNLHSNNGSLQEDAYNYTDSITALSNIYSSPEFGYSAGINFQYLLSKKFAVAGGLHLTNTGYKISHSSIPNSNAGAVADSLAGTAFGVLSYYYYPPGSDFSEIIRFKWFDISAAGSWIFWQRGKNELSFSAGIGVSKFLQYKSSNADNEQTVLTYSNSNSAALGNSLAVSGINDYALTSYAGLNYQRRLSAHFSVSGGLQFHYYLTNVLSKEFYNTLQPYWAGMNIGVSYHF